ncbi:MAG TPA: DsrE family protein [Nitrospirota bacterium]|nr:DsrE family protein [Nitrospirota bacterium]
MTGQVKNLLIIIRTTPFNTVSVPEALRMSIGLTVHDNRVSILLIDDGVWNSLRVVPHTIGRPDINDSMELFSACGIRIFADEASFKERNIAECHDNIEKISRQEAIGLILESDVTLSFG